MRASSAAVRRRRPRDAGEHQATGPAEVLTFELPAHLGAGEPPAARGLARDGVRLMVSEVRGDRVHHGSFLELPSFLSPGDLLVVNASATIPAALRAWRESAAEGVEGVDLHLSGRDPSGGSSRWVVELREPAPDGTRPLLSANAGERLRLGPGASATLIEPYRISPAGEREPAVRLWVAELSLPGNVLEYARLHGRPIRYRHVPAPWPLAMYQTVFATEPGSAEMPSAGRPFTRAVLTRLRAAGVSVAPLILHTGVSSLESGEPPYPEWYRVSGATAEAVRSARAVGGRIIAVGTTVVRALETVTRADGGIEAGSGWTDLVVTPERGVRLVDGLLTGFHEPRSSHLSMLGAIAGRRHLEVTYRAALEGGYLWHEFGDVHLMLR